MVAGVQIACFDKDRSDFLFGKNFEKFFLKSSKHLDLFVVRFFLIDSIITSTDGWQSFLCQSVTVLFVFCKSERHHMNGWIPINQSSKKLISQKAQRCLISTLAV